MCNRLNVGEKRRQYRGSGLLSLVIKDSSQLGFYFLNKFSSQDFTSSRFWNSVNKTHSTQSFERSNLMKAKTMVLCFRDDKQHIDTIDSKELSHKLLLTCLAMNF